MKKRINTSPKRKRVTAKEFVMQVKLNGQPHAVGPETTIVDLLKQADVPDSYLAVEINLDVVPREMHATQTLNEGDEIEVVTLVGGG